MTETAKILVAGMGNVLEADDGFGVHVVEELERRASLPEVVRLLEVGTGGIHLVQELMQGYDALVLTDAVDRGDPGEITVLEPHVPDIDDFSDEERSNFLADMHYTVPAKALILSSALQSLPARLIIVGCRPAALDLGLELSALVAQAVPRAADRIEGIVSALLDGSRRDSPTMNAGS